MFDLFDSLPASEKWFDKPMEEMSRVEICSLSGHRAMENCTNKSWEFIPSSGLSTTPCPYHKIIHLDPTARWRVNSSIMSPETFVDTSWFILPPRMEWFYKKKLTTYKPLPQLHPSYVGLDGESSMELIYPSKNTKIFVPVELDGSKGSAVFEVAHRNPKTSIYWHLDDKFLGTTEQFHQMPVAPKPGKHTLIVVDENGERIESVFEVMN